MKRYFQQVTNKNKICLHYTGGGTAESAISWWNDPKNPNSYVSAHYVIDRNGEISQYIPLKFWAYHASNGIINKTAIGLQIVSYGWLTINANGIYKNSNGKIISAEQVFDNGSNFKYHRYFHRILDSQWSSVKWLIGYINQTYPIARIFGINLLPGQTTNLSYATNQWSGITTHAMTSKQREDIPPSMIPQDLLNF